MGPEFYVGRNVNTEGPVGTAPYDPAGSNPYLLGNPDKKQNNEPSCDVSPTNPLVVACGTNSYAGVDRTDIVAEPWVGFSTSMDGGLSFKSHLHPGFRPKDPAAPAPLAPPLGYETAADPVVRLVPGMGLFTFIAFNRDGVGALVMGRWFERNTEAGFPYGWKDTVTIARGTGSPGDPGRFLDKPTTTVSLLPGTNTYDFVVPDPIPGNPARTRIQKVPAGVVHVGYAVFVGNTQQDGTKIVYTRSTNYGDSWAPDTTLSEAQSINQAPDIAVDQSRNRVVVVWRRFANPTAKQTDAIMAAVSNDDGRSFSKPAVVANLCAFTQGTTAASFRTTTHPFVAFDGIAFHAVWAERQEQGQCGASPTGYSRIVMSNLSFAGSTPKWSNRAPVDTFSPASRRGHEYQPAIAAVGNRLLVSWMDTRNDVRLGPSYPDPLTDPYINDYVYTDKTKVRRRAADMIAAQAFAAQTPTFGRPEVVSRYLTGLFPGDSTPRPLERNKLNARMFQSGKVPFNGDYTAAAPVRFVLKDPVSNPGEWVSAAGAPNVQPVFHLAWTDNRLVRGDVSGGLVEGTGTIYTPPPIVSASETDPTTPRGVCSPATVGSRHQAVFSSRITPPLVLFTASAAKPTVFSDAAGVQSILRTYSVVAQNTTPKGAPTRTVTLEIVPPAQAGVVASFRRVTPEAPALTTLPGIPLPARSSLARTVYVTAPASIEKPVVVVNLRENGAVVATTYLNANPHAPPLDEPLDPNDRIVSEGEVDSIEVHTPEIVYRATSIGTPAIDDPAIDDPAIDDPAIDDPAIDDPAIDDPAIDDPAIDDPAIDDPAIDDPAIDDPAIDDPAIDDPAIDDASIASSSIFDADVDTGSSNAGLKLTQITWKIALKGNTTTSMSSKVFLNVSNERLAVLQSALQNGRSQLLVSRRYRTSDARGAGCSPVRVSNYQVIANIVNPVLTNDKETLPDLVNPTSNEPSFAVPPGGAVYLTFRVWGDVPGFNANTVGSIVRSQPGVPAVDFDSDLPSDQSAPSLDLPDVTVNAQATGPSGAIVTYEATASDEVDGTVAVTCAPASGSLFGLGTTPVQCKATDSAGNEATGAFDVLVQDTTAPVLTVPATISVEATSGAGAVVTFSASATDIVTASPVTTCAPASGSTFPVGTTAVTCTALDGAGNSSSGTFNVIVGDTTAPAVTVPSNILAEATGPAGATVTFSASASDVVDGAVTPSCTPGSGSTFPLGATTVTCVATDTGGASGSASFRITVTDTTAPLVTVPASIIAEATSAAGAAVTFSASAIDIVDGALTPSCAPAPGSTFPLGTTTVTCQSTDNAGRTGSASFTVTVKDTTAPVVTVPAPITVEATGATGAVVTFSASAADVVQGTLAPTCAPASGSTFPVGTTLVSCTAGDTAGNSGSATFNVIVVDTTRPIVTVPATITAQATGPLGAAVTFSASASDLVSGTFAPVCAPAPGSTFALGTTAVTCTATDGAGNSAAATFNVTVIDTTAPVISGTPSNITVVGGTGGATVNYAQPTAADLVSGVLPVTCLPPSGSVFGWGTTPVTCTAVDGAKNVSQTSFTVTVTDATGPAIAITSVSPLLLWPPDGTMVTVTLTGTVSDNLSGVRRINWSVDDEYNRVEPSGVIDPAAAGPFTIQIQLLRDRRGNDKDGRHYLITVTATDAAGNVTAAAPIVVNVHDQSGG